MKTSTPKPSVPAWYIVDATDKPLGRLSAEIAHVLRGKHKPSWSPHQIFSDHVIVTNASQLILAGNKAEKKVYRSHSGYLGHLKTTPFTKMFERQPEKVLARAVRGMLPRNRLRPLMLKHLHIFLDNDHTHEAQKPLPLEKAIVQSVSSSSTQ